MRLAFSKAIVAELKRRGRSRLYLNVARMRNGKWEPCWTSRYLAATTLQDAQRLRALWLQELRGEHPRTGKALRPFWNKYSVRTIRII